jgi:DNA-binding GntR family transcriptional regulator
MLRDSSVLIQFRAMPDQLEQALESAIVFGEMVPGTRVIEEEIAERYRVSRSPVREALRRLESDGLLVRDERRGMRITPMSRRDLDEATRRRRLRLTRRC